jgi:flagellar L-ring protein precursor FlgH
MPLRRRTLFMTVLAGTFWLVPRTVLADATGPRSLMARSFAGAPVQDDDGEAHALRDASLFAIAPPELRTFHPHDLIQIIVRETSRAESTQELDTAKDYRLRGKVSAWPDLDLADLLQLRLFAGRTTALPEVKVDFTKGFAGEGDYTREDDLTARLTAEVIEVLPNGNLVVEARTHIKTDEEEATIKVTGVCRPDDVTAANTLLSSQIHDLTITKMHKGELKKTNQKGIIAKILDTIFAF